MVTDTCGIQQIVSLFSTKSRTWTLPVYSVERLAFTESMAKYLQLRIFFFLVTLCKSKEACISYSASLQVYS